MALTRADLANPNCLTNGDYETILSAIMETTRGRRFLAEYAKRNRHAETEMILTEISKLKCSRDDLFDFKSLLLKRTHS
jgi:hypothetical protein